MPGGRPPKPPEVHELAGHPGKRKPKASEPSLSPRPEVPSDIPAPPGHLEPLAQEVWKQHAPELHRMRLLTSIDVSMYEAFCSAYATWRQYEGLAISVGPNTAVTLGYRNAADRARQQMIRLAAMFGLQPQARNSIKTVPTGEKDLPSPVERKVDTGVSPEQLRATFRVAGAKR